VLTPTGTENSSSLTSICSAIVLSYNGVRDLPISKQLFGVTSGGLFLLAYLSFEQGNCLLHNQSSMKNMGI
jgi:hypothetical protein